jgi:hypothetical protein
MISFDFGGIAAVPPLAAGFVNWPGFQGWGRTAATGRAVLDGEVVGPTLSHYFFFLRGSVTTVEVP